MDRSKCIVCGKVRNRKYLINLGIGFNSTRWICNRSVTFGSNYIVVDDIHYSISKCQIQYLENEAKIITNKIVVLNQKLHKIDFGSKIAQSKNVIPELTFLLQLLNKNI